MMSPTQLSALFVCIAALINSPSASAQVTAALPPTAGASQSWMVGPFVKADAVNPILSPDTDKLFDCPMTNSPVAWEHDHTFNPAAVVRHGKIYVLFRAEDNSGEGIGAHTSRIGLAESKDGLHFVVHPTPVLFPDKDSQKDNEWTGGCEDPRIVETEDGGYVLLYTEWNHRTARLAAAMSRDLVHWVKTGPVFAKTSDGRFLNTYCKSGAIVTKRLGDHLIATRINGKYWMYFGEGSIYAATSANLTDWDPVLDDKGNWKPLLQPRSSMFDSALVEAGPPALVTSQGIVLLYNGKNGGSNGDKALHEGTYSGGQAMFDLTDPTKLIDRADTCFITPEKSYEITGQYAAGTDFVEGLVHFKKTWFLYYGAADSYVAVATAKD